MADNFRLNIGSLRSDVKLTLHTHHAARIWMGRPKNDLKAGIIGLSGFCTVVNRMSRGAQQDDPYSDWWMILLEEKINDSKEALKTIEDRLDNRYLLTGTPVLNRESELHTLLRLSGHPVGKLPLKEFCEQFAGSQDFRMNLRGAIGDWMLRRRKDVLPGLKGKQRQTLPIELTAEERKQYDQIRLEDRPSLARLGSLRQLLEQVKIRVVMDLLCELDAEDKVILFCEFKDTVGTLRTRCKQAEYGCVTVVGSDSVGKRQKAIDQFQSDPETRVFAATTSAAGTGNNLTAANYVMFLGLPWTPGLQDQAEDRAYRNGQLRMVVVKIPLVENTIDQMLWQMLQDKRQLASDLIEPDAAGNARQALATNL